MVNVINLRRFRKRAERESSAKQAEANRLLFGRTTAERKLEKTRKTRARMLLDQHRIERGETT
ncbi:MAG: DUF4169 family protein [Bradyrhizobium sp.]|uniref:DUF4169 family protein n=1 Tax=Bradyrhizobium sp. TaxID=376 RepID=UPI0025C61C68|nr:DUF4169 family protein [Bradyrhizobium sp.]MBI5263283.1 DUF4169 family protein [Bradyrhizobium sp.]